MQRGEVGNAKRMSYKLPYAFIQHDWKQVKLPWLAHMHDALYAYDLASKEHANLDLLELVYCDFLTTS